MAYRIEISRAAQKQVLALPRQAQVEIARAVDHLANSPRPSGCKKLRGTDLWRLRVGRHRVIYSVDDKAGLVTVLKVAPRSEGTYRGL
ncbi:MAG: type II toxin-antitoxin system RelE/ParE family toxin [Chloroflexi bacterium]|nr:type II toxin-antitoxin system RelE/ParE family toxin [Chloroflexota bacterium]